MTDTQKTQLISVAKNMVGKPYKYGAKPEEAPDFFDCSSFTQYVFKQIGIEIPRSAILQAGDSKGVRIKNESDIEIGDLIFSRGLKGHYDDKLFDGEKIEIGHVILYIDDNKIIHASSSKGVVAVQNLDEIIKKTDHSTVYIKRF